MTFPTKWISPSGTGATVTAVALYLCLGTGIAPAFAHVHASADDTTRGGSAIVTFRIPNESETGAATTEVSISLPDVASARTETLPGWTAKLNRDTAAGTVKSVTWTAAPNAGIGADQFEMFPVSMVLPDTDTDTVVFPTTQTYSDGMVVRWDQPPLPGGGEPDRPAPMLNLTSGPAAPMEHHSPAPGPIELPTASGRSQSPAAESSATPGPENPGASSDNTARLLAGGALLVSALGVGIALARRRT